MLCLCRLLPFSEAKVVLPHEEGEVGLKVYPIPERFYGKASEEEHCLSDLISLLIPSSALLPHQEQGTQMEEELDYHPALQWLQDFNQARIQLECKLGQEAQDLAQKYNDHRIKLAKKHEKKWARMTKEGKTTFQEVFSIVSSTDSDTAIALVCFFHSSLSLHEWSVGYCHTTWMKMSNLLSQHLNQMGSLALGPLSSPASSSWYSSSSNTSLARYPHCRHSSSGVPTSWVHCQPHPKETGLLFQQFTWQSSC